MNDYTPSTDDVRDVYAFTPARYDLRYALVHFVDLDACDCADDNHGASSQAYADPSDYNSQTTCPACRAGRHNMCGFNGDP